MSDAMPVPMPIPEPLPFDGEAAGKPFGRPALAGQPAARRPRKHREPVPDASDLTDVGNARRFVDEHGAKLRYCPAWGKWLVYDGARWRPDDTMAVDRLAAESIERLGGLAVKIKDDTAQKRFRSAVRSCQSDHALAAIVRRARSDARVVVTPESFDRAPFLLNCQNGTIDLKTGRIRPHDPADCLTKLAPVDYALDAACPAWDAFLRTIMADDEEMIGYLRRAVGYALTGDVSAQCLFLFYGTGSNGKSVLLETALRILGDYGIVASSNLLTTAGRNQHPTDLADLEGKRFVAISEPSGGQYDEARVKALTGGDTIRARRMHTDFHEFHPTHKFFMASNYRPRVDEVGIAIWRRIRLIEFLVTIEPEQRDSSLPERLFAEASGILNWMVRGCLEWQAKGLAEPEKVRQATREYREEMDPIAGFLAERCIQGYGLRVGSTELFSAYKSWCDDCGVPHQDRIQNITRFGELLNQKGLKRVKSSGVMVRTGLALKPTQASEPAAANSSE